MGALLDATMALVLFIIAFNFGPVFDVNNQNVDFNAAKRTQLVLQKAIDEARNTAVVTTATPGLLDNDGATITINGNQVTIYAQRPINSTTIGPPQTMFLSAPIYTTPGSTTTLQTTLFVAPNGSVLMQDGWTLGTEMNPAAGCPHNSVGVGTTFTLNIDCTTGETQVISG